MKKSLTMHIALFTSNHLRHKYVAAQIAKHLPLKLILTEEKNTAIENTVNYSSEDRKILDDHFNSRALSERNFFGHYDEFPLDVVLVQKEFGTLNSQETLDLLVANDINYILLFGTSIIKPLLLDFYPDKIVNLHLGLSPYYKGSGTNFFPIVTNEFECLGATIHLTTKRVDAGSILHQIRLEDISENDTIHSLGNKVIEKAGALYPKIVAAYLSGDIEAFPQKKIENTKEFRINDFTPEKLKQAQKVLLNLGISNYLKARTERITSKPIISNYDE